MMNFARDGCVTAGPSAPMLRARAGLTAAVAAFMPVSEPGGVYVCCVYY